MNRPPYQIAIEILLWIVFGAIAIGGLLDAVSNAITLINFKIALWTTILIFFLYSVFFFFFKKRKIRWITTSGQEITITGLSKKLKWSITGALLLLWLPMILNINKSPKIAAISAKGPIFNASDTRFKILVLPFDEECEYEGEKYKDIGEVISRRLEVLNEEDSLNLTTHYLTDSINLENINSRTADEIMKFNNANQIIYGFYSTAKCENDTTDKICFNYRTDSIGLKLLREQPKMSYNMVEIEGLSDIRDGTGQEDIDYIIYLMAAVSSIKENKVERAINLFKKIKNYTEDEVAQIGIGISYIMINDFLNAKKCFEKALIVNPKNDAIFIDLGNCYINLNNFSKAKECFEKALKINPRNDIALNNLGNMYAFIYNDSIAGKIYFEKSIEVNPNNDLALSNLGVIYFRLKNYPQAEKFYSRSIAVNPNNDKSLDNLGFLYMALNDFQKAKTYFQKAIEINPNSPNRWTELGKSYEALGEFRNAIIHYLKAVQIIPKQSMAWYNQIGFCYASLGDYATAKNYFINSLELDPNFVGALNNLGNCYKELKDSINALKVFEKSIKIDPNSNTSWYNLGILYWEFKNYLEAKKCFERVSKINPQQHDALYALASIYSIQRNSQKTYFYLQKSIALKSSLKVSAKSDSTFQWLWGDFFFNSITQ